MFYNKHEKIMLFLIVFVISCTLTAGFSGPGIYQIIEPIDHAECPTWDTRNGLLYFVNIHQGEIYRYDYESEEIKHIKLDGQVSSVIPSKNDPNLLIAGLNRSIVAVEWDGDSEPSQTRILVTVSDEFPTSRFNDGKADKEGRLWIGTMGFEDSDGTLTPNEGLLYEVTCDTLSVPLVEIAPVNISNGAAWNKANDKYYYIDTPSGHVVEYVYNDTDGTITHPRLAFDISQYSQLTGGPDGMTIDADDNLWIALYGGGAVIKVDPATGILLQVVAVPARDVTSAMWGGPDLDVLFITTSRVSLTEEEKKQNPGAGAVFAVVGLGTQGLPVYAVDLLESIDDQDCGAGN